MTSTRGLIALGAWSGAAFAQADPALFSPNPASTTPAIATAPAAPSTAAPSTPPTLPRADAASPPIGETLRQSSASSKLPAPAGTEGSPSKPPPPRNGRYLHDGFYLRYALGPGVWNVVGTASTSPDGSGAGASEILAVGGTLPRGIVVAAAASAIISSKATLGNYGVLVDWFPDPERGYHLGALLGLGVAHTAIPNVVTSIMGQVPSGGEHLSTFGPGASILAGYDAWLTPQFSMGISLMASATTPMTAVDAFGNSTADHLTPLWFGLMVSVLYH